VELKKAVNLFLNNQRETTRQSYKYPLKYFVAWMGESRLVESIRPEHLVEYDQMSLKPRDYAPATERKHIKTLKTLFNWLIDLDVIDKSPARVLKAKRLPMYIERDKAMTDEELALLLDHAINHPRKTLLYRNRDYALILFLADTGCRIGGAAGLKVSEIDFESRRASVVEKGDKRRKVKFGPLCAVALARYVLMRPRAAGAYVFSTGKGPIKADNISLMLRRMCRQLGLRVLSGHSLRHRKGHQLADSRVAPSIAATALGHADPVTTLMNYYPADWASAEAELDKLATPPDLLPTEPKTVISLQEIIRRNA
jgi:integrase